MSREHDIDVVIATESLSTLADNEPPDYCRTWQIPVTVRQLKPSNRKCVFVDSPIILNTLTGRERGRVVYDQLLRQLSLQRDMHETKRLRESQCGVAFETPSHRVAAQMLDVSSDSDGEFGGFDLSSDLTVEEVRVLSSDETDFELQIVTDSDTDNQSAVAVDSKHSTKNSITRSPDKLQDPCDDKCFVYNVWKFGDLTVLVRSTSDGTIEDRRMKGKVRRLCVVPKLEFQAEYGYEVVTQSECADWWVGSFIRPRSHVAIGKETSIATIQLKVLVKVYYNILYSGTIKETDQSRNVDVWSVSRTARTTG